MDLTRRRTLSTALALVLALESITVVTVAAGVALSPRSATHPLPAASPAGEVLAQTGTASRASEPAAAPAVAPAPVGREPLDVVHSRAASAPSAGAGAPGAGAGRPAEAVSGSSATSAPAKAASAAKGAPAKATQGTTRKSRPAQAMGSTSSTAKSVASTAGTAGTSAPSTPASAPSYSGQNHVWIPALGINQPVSFFSCDRAAAPDNYVYRWGCAGSNNVYLLGHASGVFRALHDSYLNGRLQVGMRVYYADDSGTTHLYTVQWWKLTRPTTDASWAWASQEAPSMTLQTCMGANSQYRLMVRLVQAG
jgi:hypothetical protein